MPRMNYRPRAHGRSTAHHLWMDTVCRIHDCSLSKRQVGAWMKLSLFGLTQFKRVVYPYADTLPIGDVTHLASMPMHGNALVLRSRRLHVVQNLVQPVAPGLEVVTATGCTRCCGRSYRRRRSCALLPSRKRARNASTNASRGARPDNSPSRQRQPRYPARQRQTSSWQPRRRGSGSPAARWSRGRVAQGRPRGCLRSRPRARALRHLP